MLKEPAYTRLPRVPLWRRSAAFAIDFFLAGLVSLFLANLLIPTFIIAWFSLRVIVAAKNKGQSLGRYALDLKVVDPRYGRVPGIMELCQREGILGTGALLALMGIYYLSPTNAWAVLLMIPLPFDCGFAYVDRELRQAFHDQIADTIVVGTRRGYSLDLRLKRLFANFNRDVRR